MGEENRDTDQGKRAPRLEAPLLGGKAEGAHSRWEEEIGESLFYRRRC